MKTAVGLAELLCVIEGQTDARAERFAALLGFRAPEAPVVPQRQEPKLPDAALTEPTPEEGLTIAEGGAEHAQSATPMTFWRVESVIYSDEPEVPAPTSEVRPLTRAEVEEGQRVLPRPPKHIPLASWSRLTPCLRSALLSVVPGSQPDVPRVLRALSRGTPMSKVPMAPRRQWAQRVSLWVDRTHRLTPFWADQDDVRRRLRRMLGRSGVTVRVLRADAQARSIAQRGDLLNGHLSDPTVPVLVLGDVGAYGDATEQRAWLRTARRLRDADVRVTALVPAPRSRWKSPIAKAWRATPWERGRRAGRGAREGGVSALLTLASMAAFVEPGLLRALRLLLSPDEVDAATEVDVWTHDDVYAPDSNGMMLRAARVAAWRDAFDAMSAVARKALVARAIGRWHGALSEELLHAETLTWISRMPSGSIAPPGDLDAAKRVAERAAAVHRGGDEAWADEVHAWGRSFLGDERGVDARDVLLREVPSLQRVWVAAFRGQGGVRVPAGVDAEGLYRELDAPGPLTHWSVRQVGAELVVQRAEGSAWPSQSRDAGSPVACIEATRGQLTVGAFEAKVPQELEHEPWMAATGVDDYGRWAAVNLCDVMVRFRWIPPGTFTMGSPESEEGRNYDEGPQHEVTLTQGYWMADTPVTQALWTAVMGENPSSFQGAERPVEQVSWDDCQRFIETLRTYGPGFDVRLPTEAEWEYACRAGTTTATWLGDNNLKVLDAIAWYGDNSGGETHAVRGKQPNPYGLHDMLGNVSEWCANCWSTYSAHETDPYVAAGGADRVIRGGSWNDDARLVRAAYCVAYLPGVRFHSLGFRLVRGQAQGQRAEPLAAERPVPRGAGRDERPVLHALTLAPRVPLRASMGLSLRTDRSTIVVAPWQREGWASAAGRDRYGLWAEARVGEAVLRFRWIPPGRFMMGSPKGEAGRYDNEGPQHEVTFTEGRWMADAPVTQALWTAVMDENPSYFVSPERPVEQVSWDDCKAFIEKLNAAVPDLGARLPSEAEWEYACRAGTTTATWVGDMEIVGQRNAPVLDAIAWYGGNSGVGFELENGDDSSGWSEKQYEYLRAGTHAVRTRAASPHGLYDMLGNVWEWCEDWHAPYSERSAIDPTLPARGSDRVNRGGSWFVQARSVRAAFRNAALPGYRDDNLGFRLVRGPGLRQEAEPVDAERPAARRPPTKKGSKR